MFGREAEAVLSLTAFTIFADKRVYATEIQSFIECATKLNDLCQPEIPMTEAKILLWFEMNRSQLRDKMNLGPAGLKRWLTMLMEDLSTFPDKPLILDLMKKISTADGEYHISERALYVLSENNLELVAT